MPEQLALDLTPAVDLDALARFVMAHAETHYNEGGWDVIVECFGHTEIVAQLAEDSVTTEAEALASFADQVDHWAEREADARHSAF